MDQLSVADIAVSLLQWQLAGMKSGGAVLVALSVAFVLLYSWLAAREFRRPH